MMTKICTRCNEDSQVSNIGEALMHFVCDRCRQTHSGWEFNGLRVEDMEYASPEPNSVKLEREAKRETNQYR